MSFSASDQPSELSQIMQPEEMERLGVDSMTSEQKKVLFEWGMKMRSIGHQIVQAIKLVKYEGRLIILEDGSRWEVDIDDIYTSEDWEKQNQVLIMNGIMWNLDEMEKVKAQEEII